MTRITWRLFVPILISISVLVLLAAVPAMGQLTQEDIEDLRERGKREGWTFTVDLCEANSRYSLEQLCGHIRPEVVYDDMAPPPQLTVSADLPASWNWREMDGLTPVKNQYGCGSCWAFAAVAMFESAIRIRDGRTVDLSEQWLVSCNRDGMGCNGGNFFCNDYHEFKKDLCHESGAVLETFFPYVAYDAPCNCPHPHDYWIDDWKFIVNGWTVPSTDSIKQAVMEYGPVDVAVYANDAWFGYSGGVFNACANYTTNHEVLIVGWDDDYEGQGVWIIKNSWGADWGDRGYMYIPYGCSFIGEGACYVEYGQSGMAFWADTCFGWAPADINFDAFSTLDVNTWTWAFGDGDSAFVQTPPTHTYQDPGLYDVTLQIDVGSDTRSLAKQSYIVVAADTLRGDTVSGMPGSQIEMVVTANNTAPLKTLMIPVEFASDFGLVWNGYSIEGCRTGYFEIDEYRHWDASYGKRVTIRLISSTSGTSPDLQPGEGPVLKLFFTIPETAIDGQSAVVALDGYLHYLPFYYGDLANYQVGSREGLVQVQTSCCFIPGDVDHDGETATADITYLINHAFLSGPAPPCFEEADANDDGELTIGDIAYLINWAFLSGPDPAPCP